MRLFASILLLIISFGFILAEGFDGVTALLLTGLFAVPCIYLIKWADLNKDFVINMFLLALTVRLAFGLFIHVWELREFFGGDALTFDIFGKQIADVWSGKVSDDDWLSVRAMSTSQPGWGIHYFVGGLYYMFGPNILAAQSLIGLVGAAIVPLLYHCSYQIFANRRVSAIAAVLAALFPAFVVWTAQLLKDGVVIFFLVLSMTMVLVLQRKLNYVAIVALVIGLAGVLSFRFYIFYMLVIAVAGSFVIGRRSSVEGFVRGLALLIFVGLALTYIGVLNTATENLERFGSLETLQRSREDLATSADSGFGAEADVSTTQGALTTIPIGFTYLMFAPFPWQAASIRQSITIPETIVWWAMFPLIVTGLIYSIKNKLRASIPVIVFTLLLTLGYSIFQGNVGTAYRHRTQIQVFLFIFVGVGGALILERRENQKILADVSRKRFEDGLRNHGIR